MTGAYSGALAKSSPRMKGLHHNKPFWKKAQLSNALGR
jgi:hypothetical protein